MLHSLICYLENLAFTLWIGFPVQIPINDFSVSFSAYSILAFNGNGKATTPHFQNKNMYNFWTKDNCNSTEKLLLLLLFFTYELIKREKHPIYSHVVGCMYASLWMLLLSVPVPSAHKHTWPVRWLYSTGGNKCTVKTTSTLISTRNFSPAYTICIIYLTKRWCWERQAKPQVKWSDLIGLIV